MKTAIIGCGRMGQRHITAAKKLNLKIVGVFDKSTKAKLETKKKFNLKDNFFFSNLEIMMKQTKPPLVIIATTADTHLKFTLLSIKFGAKFILLEKPAATSIIDCETIDKAAKKNNVRISVNHQMKFQKPYKIIKDLLDSKKFGGLKSMNILAGNIGLAMNGMHYMEGFRYLTKEKFISVNAWLKKNKEPNPRGKKFKDVGGQILAFTKTGKRFYLEASNDQSHGIHLVFIAKNGIITFDELLNDISYSVRKLNYLNYPSYRFGMPSDYKKIRLNFDNMTLESTTEVLKNLINKKKLVSVMDAANHIKTLHAAYMSSKNKGLTISLKKKFNKKTKYAWA